MKGLSTLNFPVIRGVQAGREYFVTMWTLRMLRQVATFDDTELPAEMRAQRVLNKARIPEIASYILKNPENYVFSAITVSIDSEVEFQPLSTQTGSERLGILKVPTEARFVINDGQHRRAAILAALEERPELATETISVVFFLDIGLERSQQMFADLNRYAIRPNRSLGILYDHRNDKAKLARLIVMKSDIFKDIVEYEKTSLAPRSRKLFTLSAFYNASSDLLKGIATGDIEEDAKVARGYWEELAKHFSAWVHVRDGKISSKEVREGFIHAHGIALHALGRAGNALLQAHPRGWKGILPELKKIDWARSNASLWEGRALIGGKVSKVTTNVSLTTNIVKLSLDLPLSPEEKAIEASYKKRA